MGLDMYLTKEVYVGANYEHRNVKGTIDITSNGVKVPINFNSLISITEEVAYWRKFNALHNWFVQEVQKGIDDHKIYSVDFSQLELLCNTCIETKNTLNTTDKANWNTLDLLLTPTAGFFFGSTAIDNYFYEELTYTIDVLKNLDKHSHYYYSASW